MFSVQYFEYLILYLATNSKLRGLGIQIKLGCLIQNLMTDLDKEFGPLQIQTTNLDSYITVVTIFNNNQKISN